MKSRFILSTLTLLGFSSCSDEWGNIITTPDMYGTPISDFRFMGEVTDSEGNPIKGIEVKVSSASESTLTDDQGAFSTEFKTYIDGTHTITFTDIDGEENGGEFISQQVEVKWDDAEDVDGVDQFDLGTVELIESKINEL
ncbi:MAG: radical SAM-associated putative lipoprotein [Rikenellaceae bacterium]